MSIATKDVKNFKDACRENTGSHFLDSGGAYGRHHEAPPIPEEAPIASWSASDIGHGCGPTINTGVFLDTWSQGGPDAELQERFERFAEDSDASWFEDAQRFCEEELGLTCAGRDNVYNGENDLSQVFVWEVWNDGESGDWIYPDESTVTVIFVHTGCDVRGGYGHPLFVRPESVGCEYSIPVDVVAGLGPVAARKLAIEVGDTTRVKIDGTLRLGTLHSLSEDGVSCWVEVDGRKRIVALSDLQRCDTDAQNLWEIPGVDEWGIGYSSAPSYHFFEAVERVFPWTFNPEELTVVCLHQGYLIKVGVEVRAEY